MPLSSRPGRAVGWLAPLLLSLLLFGYHLGTPGLWTDESIYAQTAREMAEQGEWITPQLCHEPYLIKPVLYDWLAVIAFRMVGENEWGARLPQALAGLIGVVATSLFAGRFSGRRGGVLAGMILATSLGYAMGSRVAGMDVLLTCCISLCLFCFYRGYVDPGRQVGWFVLAGVAAGVGMLAKGPLGAGLPGLVVFCFLLRRRELSLALSQPALGGLAACWATAAIWYLPVWARHGADFTRVFWLRNNLARLAGPVSEHAGPIIYYLPVLLIALLPWSFPFGYALGRSFLAFLREPLVRHRPLSEFLWIWFLVPLLFFSIIGTKLAGYILPVFPAVAILTAWEWDRHRDESFSASRGFRITASIGVLCLPGLALAVPYLLASRYGVDSEFGWAYLLLTIIPAAAALASALLPQGRLQSDWWVLAAAMFVLGFVQFAILPVAPYESMKEMTGRLLDRRDQGATVALAGGHLKGTFFYTGCSLRMVREMESLPPPEPDRPLFCLVKDRFRPDLERWVKRKALSVKDVDRRGPLALLEVTRSRERPSP